jgi:hypothetical protein
MTTLSYYDKNPRCASIGMKFTHLRYLARHSHLQSAGELIRSTQTGLLALARFGWDENFSFKKSPSIKQEESPIGA